MEAAGINGCQRTPWTDEIDGKEFHGALGGEYDLEPRGSIFSCTRSQHSPSEHLQMGYYAGFKGDGVFA